MKFSNSAQEPFKWFYNRVAHNECAPGSFSEYNKPSLIPIYIVCDEGAFNEGNAVVRINGEISKSITRLRDDLLYQELLRISLISSNSVSRILMSSTPLQDLVQTPKFSNGAVSNYIPLFELLKVKLENDVLKLHERGFMLTRPLVFFITQGRPNDTFWIESFNELVREDFRFRPNLVLYGVQDYEVSVLTELAAPILSVGPGRMKGLDWEPDVSLADALVYTLRYTADI